MLELLIVIYVGITIYDAVAHGRSPIQAACWPLLTATKILVWIGKQDPSLNPETASLEARITALENTITQLTAPPTPNPSPTPTPSAAT